MAWWQFWRRGARQGSAATARAVDPSRRSILGRRFVAGVPYVLPKDDAEINRLDFQHYMLRSVLRSNYAAPIDRPRDIVDVGTGTGWWAAEMAIQFPQANVIGLDIVPPPADEQSARSIRPGNYVFVAGNILEGLPFEDASFDFVHQRMLVGAIPAERWQSVVNELARITRRGQWVELLEAGSAVGGGRGLETLNYWGITAAARRGITISMSERIGSFLEQAGLAKVTFREVRIPLGKHGGRLGSMMEANYRKWAIHPPVFSRGMNGPSDVRPLLKNSRLSTWTIPMKGTPSMWWSTTSPGTPSGAGRCR